MSERREPPKGTPLDGDARPARGRVRDLGSLDATRATQASVPAAADPVPAAPVPPGRAVPRREPGAGERRRDARTGPAKRDSTPSTPARREGGPRRDVGARGPGRRDGGGRDAPQRGAERGSSQRNERGGAGRSARSDAGADRSGRDRPVRRGPDASVAARGAGPQDPYARHREAAHAARRPPPLQPSAHPGAQSRAIAARVLDAVLHRGRSLKAELAASLPALADPRDRALVEAICFAVLRQPLRFEAALSAWMPKPLSSRDGELRALLYVGLAQLDPLRLAAHAALDATVEAARLLGHTHQAGLVNALLRRAQRDGLPATDPRHSHWPSWLRGMLRKDWPEHYDAILAHSATPPPMWLRVNRARIAREDYREALTQAGIEAFVPTDLDDALRLDAALPVAALPGFADGEVSVQDASAQRCADALAPPAGARVLDACAAPGGKSAHLLERDPSLRLTALDIDAARLQRVRATLHRAGFAASAAGRIDLHAADAADTDAWWDGEPFDAVLLDAPCSATGIVRRQPDVVLHRRESDIAALSLLQARLLDALWRTVAPGGVLLYATCSILHAENETQIRAFLQRTGDARAEPLEAAYGHDREVGRQRLPGEDGGDGFFYARLRRVG